jgi:hypothetical protein
MQHKKEEGRAGYRGPQMKCTEFYVDVSIIPPKTYYSQQWRQEKKKVRRQQKVITEAKKRKAAGEQALYGHIAKSIKQKVRRYHSIGDLEVVITAVAPYMWRQLMRGWREYVPQRRRPGYYVYRKTHSATVFLESFPGTQLDKLVAVHLVMRITIGEKVAARAMYNRQERKMVLNFYYQPFPFPAYWFPTFKAGSKPARGQFKHKKCWLDKEKKKIEKEEKFITK